MRTREGGRIVVGEAVVIARVRAGEPEAYAELVRAHTGIAIRVARALGAVAGAPPARVQLPRKGQPRHELRDV